MPLNNLRRGLVVSCGCFRRQFSKEKATTHDKTKTAEYSIWAAMKRRCLNPNMAAYKDYGGRGIKICDRWLKFENFIADMGSRPDGHSIDRIDTNGNYEPSNCRWATAIEQANNTRGNRLITINGERLPMTEACKRAGVPFTTVATRVHRGWPEDLWLKPKGFRRAPLD